MTPHHQNKKNRKRKNDMPETVTEEVLEDFARNTVSDREQELQGDIQRLNAEYVNYRKRVERDRDVARDTAVRSTLNALLPVLDDLDAARKHGDLEEGPFRSIADKMEGILAQLGLAKIDEAGVPFNPEVHEAVIVQPHEEIPADHVSMVFRSGYLMGEKVLRAAQVAVSAG